MAYVTGPLHSLEASGQIAEEIIFQTYNGRTYAKAYAVPGNTPGFNKMNQKPAQLAVQAITKSLMQAWKTIAPADQATWDALAKPNRISRVNAYLKYNFARHTIGLDPTEVYPPLPPAVPGANLYTGGTVTPNLNNWTATFTSGGSLTQNGNAISCTADLKILYATNNATLNGQFDLTGLTALTTLNLYGTSITEPPVLTGLTALTTLVLARTQITEPPVLTGLTALTELDLNRTAMSEVDSIFNTLAATADVTAYGYCNVSGGTSAAPTTASAAARNALSTGTGNWTLAYN